jgi:EAL domain-containing protein (putative c-di-GMP-specific phosphodiesterase class I)
MDAEIRRRANMTAALRRALDRNELHLAFQPRQSLFDDRIVGVEALLRWTSEEFGDVPPSVFIPLAEENGMILPIGEWVMEQACQTLCQWRSQGVAITSIAVNVSVLQMARGDLPATVARVLASTGLPASSLELEITETVAMANAEQTISVLRELKRLGVGIVIDDFGTGYSSLVYLKRFPIDTLKIDREFVGDLTRDPDDEAIVTTIISMAHSLGLNVVAEGVETTDQLGYLRERNCDEIQGYLLSRPLAEADCFQFMLDWAARHEQSPAS